jgi:hypothetical protein
VAVLSDGASRQAAVTGDLFKQKERDIFSSKGSKRVVL